MTIESQTNDLLEQTGAVKRGHYLLSSGLHSDRYCQCAALFEQPAVAAQVASLFRELLPPTVKFDTVLTPAIGGILWGYELARTFGARSLFAERKPGETFALGRGFALSAGERVLLAEDVVTTGKSVLELVPLVEQARAVVTGFAAIADRSRGTFLPGAAAPFFALTRLDFQTWRPVECELCERGIPIEKPGSRILKEPAR